MASLSPGEGPASGLRRSQQHLPSSTTTTTTTISREDRLFLGTQENLTDWTITLPGETEVKAGRRRDKIKSLLIRISQACLEKMEVLAGLRNKRDRCSSNRRPEFRGPINTLRLEVKELWEYLGGFFDRGAGEVSFLQELGRTLQQASEEGSQAVRRRSGRSGSQTPKQPGKSGGPGCSEGGASSGGAGPSKAIKPGEGSRGSIPRAVKGSGGSAKSGEPNDPGGRRAQVPPGESPQCLQVVIPRLPREGHAAAVEACCVPGSVTPQLAVEQDDLAVSAPGTAPAAGKTPGESRVHGSEVKTTKTVKKVPVCSMAKMAPVVGGGVAEATFPSRSQPLFREGGCGLPSSSTRDLGKTAARKPEVAGRGPEVGPREPEVVTRGPEVAGREFAAVVTSAGGPSEDLEGEGLGVEGHPVLDFVADAPGCPQPMDGCDGDGKTSSPPQVQMDTSSGLPAAQEGQEGWGECQAGPLPVDCPAYNYIRQMEGSQGDTPPVRVESQGAGEVLEGSGWPAEWGSLLGDVPPSVAAPSVAAPGGEGPVVRPRVVGQGGSAGVDVSAGVGAIPPAGTGAPPSPPTSGGAEGGAPLPENIFQGSPEANLLSALRGGRSFAQVAGSRAPLDHLYSRFGAQNFRAPPADQEGTQGAAWTRGTGGPERRRRNVVQLRYEGPDPCPARGEVVGLVLSMGFGVGDLFAVIHPTNTREFDISFVTPVCMERFITSYGLVRGVDPWRRYRLVPISRQEEVKNVTVLVRNESLPPEDIATWLGRYGQLQTPLRKNLDERGVWTGAWLARIRLKREGNSVAHLPGSAFIGRDRILAFYPGQPRRCFKCGCPTHMSSDCTVVRCGRCHEFGHQSESCGRICCNLCGEMGHPFSRCPKAYRGPSSGGGPPGSGTTEDPPASDGRGAGEPGAPNAAPEGPTGPLPQRRRSRRGQRGPPQGDTGSVGQEAPGFPEGTAGGEESGGPHGPGSEDPGSGPSPPFVAGPIPIPLPPPPSRSRAPSPRPPPPSSRSSRPPPSSRSPPPASHLPPPVSHPPPSPSSSSRPVKSGPPPVSGSPSALLVPPPSGRKVSSGSVAMETGAARASSKRSKEASSSGSEGRGDNVTSEKWQEWEKVKYKKKRGKAARPGGGKPVDAVSPGAGCRVSLGNPFVVLSSSDSEEEEV